MNDRFAIYVTTGFVIAFILIVASIFGITKRILGFYAPKRTDTRMAKNPQHPISPRMWIVLIGSVAFVTYLITPRVKDGNVPPNPTAGFWGIALSVVLFFLVATLIIVFNWLKNRDAVSARAIKRASEGDRNGAIAELLEDVETRGPKENRLNTLGNLYIENEQFNLALNTFIDAEKLNSKQPVFRANQAIALQRLGRVEEAEAIFYEVCKSHPQVSVFHALYCLVFADLGRWDEARRQLQLIDELPKVYDLSRASREARKALLQKCRDRVADAVSKPSLDHSDDLI